MSNITREFEDWEEYDKTPTKKFEWGDEKTEMTATTEKDFYKQKLKELWLFWTKEAKEAEEKECPEDIVAYYEGKAKGFAMSYSVLCDFDFPNKEIEEK